MNAIGRRIWGLAFVAAAMFGLAMPVGASTNDISGALQRGLFEEEANHNLTAAMSAYQAVAAQFDTDRKLAGTAVFRLGECYRKQGNTNAATVQYERVLREFTDQAQLVAASREALADFGVARPAAVAAQVTLESAPVVDANNNEVAWLKRLQAMQKESPDLLNAPEGAFGYTPLQTAAQSGSLRVARFLVENGADVEAKSVRMQNDTALHVAAMRGNLEMVEFLLDHGAGVQPRNDYGITPLHLAAEHGFKSVVEVLLAHGADVNSKSGSGATPLIFAVANGFKLVSETLLAHGADPNATAAKIHAGGKELQGAALNIVAELNADSLAETLLTHGAKLEIRDEWGRTPLQVAASCGSVRAARVLITHGADVNAKVLSGYYAGFTPLLFAVENNKTEMAELLLNSGADPNARMENIYGQAVRGTGYTPLLIATRKAYPEIVEVLLKGKADPNAASSTGDRPILNTFALDDAEMRRRLITLLLEHGADVDARDSEGDSALMLAANHSEKATAGLLLAHKASPNAQNDSGWSALHFAAEAALRGNESSLAELLVKAGANVNLTNKNGRTPLGMITAAAQRFNGFPILPGQPMPSFNGRVSNQKLASDAPCAALSELLRKNGATEPPSQAPAPEGKPPSGQVVRPIEIPRPLLPQTPQ